MVTQAVGTEWITPGLPRMNDSMLDSLNSFVMKKKDIFPTSTQNTRTSLSSIVHYIRYVEDKCQGQRIAFLEF